MRSFPSLLAFALTAALLAIPAPQSARADDVLYVGDGGDNTIKGFDASSGAFLGRQRRPVSRGLAGPRGMHRRWGTLRSPTRT